MRASLCVDWVTKLVGLRMCNFDIYKKQKSLTYK